METPQKMRPTSSTLKLLKCFVKQPKAYVATYVSAAFFRPLNADSRETWNSSDAVQHVHCCQAGAPTSMSSSGSERGRHSRPWAWNTQYDPSSGLLRRVCNTWTPAGAVRARSVCEGADDGAKHH